MLLPSKSAPINRSRVADRLVTMLASRLPCFESRNMLARDAPVSAVSLAAKNAETRRQTMTTANVIQSMMRHSLHLHPYDDPGNPALSSGEPAVVLDHAIRSETRFPLFRIMLHSFSMIRSENRFPLFRIMLRVP